MRLLLLIATIVLLQGQNAPPDQGAANFVRPAYAGYAVPDAADHVAVMVVTRGWGQPGENRVTITQSGHWLKEEAIERGESSTSVSDLRSGVSFSFSRSDGQYHNLSIAGRSGGMPVTIEKTRETDRLLGETCTIWRFRWKDSGTGIVENKCLTRDNILLWQRMTGKGASDLGSARAISIERRKIRPTEVALPVTLASLSSWMRAPVASATTKPNDEVLLADVTPVRVKASRQSVLVRRFGGYLADDKVEDRTRTRRWFGGGVGITLIEAHDGSLRRLDIGRSPQRVDVVGLAPSTPISPASTRSILNRRCIVTDMAPNVSDFSRIDCLSENGLLLARTESGRGGTTLDVVATRVSVGTLTPRDVMPPADLLNPARWIPR